MVSIALDSCNWH